MAFMHDCAVAGDATCIAADAQPSILNATDACTLCMESVTRRETMLLGESGEVFRAAQAALEEIRDVHNSDALMHFEFFGPFWELSEARPFKQLAVKPSATETLRAITLVLFLVM
jgi:hypothetical protein